VVYLKDSGINPDFRTLKGKRIGYVGEFGKVCAGAKSIIIDIC
jgi:pyrimidine precursor biosynthesis enzyme